MTKSAFLLVLFGLLALPVFGESFDGGYAGSWLQVPVGARPTAMGGAYLAVSNDGAAPLFNPAGLATLSRPMVSSSYRAMKLGRKMSYVTAVSPIRGESTMGVHWLFAGSGSVEARDADGYPQGHDLSMAAHSFAVVFAKQITPYLAAGVNLNYILLDLSELDANAVGFDFGVMLYVEKLFDRERRDQLAVRDIQFGLTVKNFSKRFRWLSDDYNVKYKTSITGTEQEDEVPIEVGLGGSARFLDRKLLTSIDVYKNGDQGARLHAGAEYFFTPEFMLRSGFSDGRLAAGTGYLFTIGNNALAIDYAFSTDKADEGSEHIFSFDFLF